MVDTHVSWAFYMGQVVQRVCSREPVSGQMLL